MDSNPYHLDLPSRPRRNRRSAAIRGLVRETSLSPSDLIYPLFVQDGPTEPIDAMPGLSRWSLDDLVDEVKRAHALGINAVVLFPKVPDDQKTETGEHAYAADGLAQRAIAAVKQAVPEVCVITDVALGTIYELGSEGGAIATAERDYAFVVGIVSSHVGDINEGAVAVRASRNGKYVSVTVTFEARNQEQLDALYRELSGHERILMVL